MKKKVYIHTFGCQMNVHDSEKILGVLQDKGYRRTDTLQDAELIVFNTCSIRQKAEQKFYSELGRIKNMKKKRPDLRIAVAGCIAQKDGARIFKKAPHVDFVFGPQNIHKLRDFISDRKRSVSVSDNPSLATEDLPIQREDSIKAWIAIMYGCNNFCSYCVVPYTRGRERSRPSEQIYQEVSEVAGKGCREITLLGQNVNSYRSDTDFPGLLRMLDSIVGIERIRFVTSHPKDLSHVLIAAMSTLKKVCEHIHLPLQSGSDEVLNTMNRGYSYKAYREKVSLLREHMPDIAITSDIITGFPGETADDHTQTLRALEEIAFDGIFAFKFSPRPGTRAAALDEQIPDMVKTRRLDEILRLQDRITLRKNRALEGSVFEVLIEGLSDSNKEKMFGRTRTNKIVTFPGIDIDKGSMLQLEITRGRKHSLEGRPLRG